MSSRKTLLPRNRENCYDADRTFQGLSTHDGDGMETSRITAEVCATERNDRFMNDLASRVGIEPTVTGIGWEKPH